MLLLDAAAAAAADASETAFFVSSARLAASTYEALMWRGWRRSGDVLYLPDIASMCCRHYMTRVCAGEVRASRSQRRAVARFNRYVLGGGGGGGDDDWLRRVCAPERQRLPPEARPAHVLDVQLRPAGFDEERYLLWRDYQQRVHGEDEEAVGRRAFRDFLCDSPLHGSSSGGVDCGTYHQTWRLDGVLVALGVLDILPHSISSVYFAYGPSLAPWSPGRLSALRETALARHLGCTWYSMGYYIPSCAKMRYKAELAPLMVLEPLESAPATLAWRALDAAAERRLEQNRHGSAPTTSTPTTSSPTTSSAVWARTMPGVLTREQLAAVDLGAVRVRLAGVAATRLADLDVAPADIDDPRSLVRFVAELVACLGVEVACRVVLCFGGE
jgi:arginine-tRNA-protein transferase